MSVGNHMRKHSSHTAQCSRATLGSGADLYSSRESAVSAAPGASLPRIGRSKANDGVVIQRKGAKLRHEGTRRRAARDRGERRSTRPPPGARRRTARNRAKCHHHVERERWAAQADVAIDARLRGMKFYPQRKFLLVAANIKMLKSH